MKKNRGMILLALVLASFACADVIATKEADFRSGLDTEGKQRGKLEAGDELSQNDKTDERYNVQITPRISSQAFRTREREELAAENEAIFDPQVKYGPFYKAAHNGAENPVYLIVHINQNIGDELRSG